MATTKGALGGFAEYAICPAAATFEMPDDIPLPDAAALYFPFHLAWLGLFDRAELQAGETVLIHAAAGGSGSAAVQLAHHAGARSSPPPGRDEKVELCRELGADVAIDYTTDDFAEVVLAETDDAGVDVVFDNVGEAVIEQSHELHRVQRPLPDDGVRLQQGRGRRAVHRPPAGAPRQPQAVRRAPRLRRPTTWRS